MDDPILNARFWALVDTSGECWMWLGAPDNRGYGKIRHNGIDYRAHRLSYMLANPGDDICGLSVMHSCDTPMCVRPDHLSAGTHADNMRDMAEKGRGRSGALRGERSHLARLSDADVAAIRSDPRPQHAIARAYGVSQAYVSRLKRGVRR